MKQMLVLSTATLLAAAGNRDFVHIYNNGSETIFIGYDGKVGSGADITGWLNVNLISSGATVSSMAIATLSPTLRTQDIQQGMDVIHAGIPKNVHVASITVAPTLVTLVFDVSFVALSDIGVGDALTFSNKLTVDNGWPVPAGTWYALNTDGTKNIFNKEVLAIAVTGPVDVRLEGV